MVVLEADFLVVHQVPRDLVGANVHVVAALALLFMGHVVVAELCQ